MFKAAKLAFAPAPVYSAPPRRQDSAGRRLSSDGFTGNQAVLRRLSRTSPRLQTKLEIGSVDDPLEKEADLVADHVMRMPDNSGVLRRACTECADEDKKLQRNSGGQSTTPAEALPIVHEALRSRGEPLDHNTRVFFEPRFGRDLSGVRIHTGDRANMSALALNAEAYTLGHDIVFADGMYAPASESGRLLLAHELTHVAQQVGSGSLTTASLAINRSPAGAIQRATKKGCVAPSFVVDKATASLFGTVAESIVESDYLAKMGGSVFADVFLDSLMGQVGYIAFLIAHHPGLDAALLALQIGLAGGVLIPDILDTRSTAGGSPEYYDVKPDSPDGRFAGRGKLAAIDAFMGFNSLPYVRGSAYAPTPSIPMPISSAVLGAIIGLPVVLSCGLPIVTLAPIRLAPGLLVYQICVEADLDCYLKVIALEALIAAIIVAILFGAGLLPLPAPIPVPAVASSGDGTGDPGQAAAGGQTETTAGAPNLAVS